MRRVRRLIIFIVSFDFLFCLVVMSVYYHKHPDSTKFDQKQYRSGKWLDEFHLNYKKSLDIYNALGKEISFFDVPNKELIALNDLSSYVLKQRHLGFLVAKDGELRFSNNLSGIKIKEIEKQLEILTDKFNQVKTPTSKEIITGSNEYMSYKKLFNLHYFESLSTLSKNKLSQNGGLSSFFIDLKSIFRITNSDEEAYLNEINKSLALYPVFCSNQSGLNSKLSFTQKLSVELGQLIFGTKNAISHGLIGDHQIIEIQYKSIKELSRKYGFKINDNYHKEVLQINATNGFEFSRILAYTIYISMIIGIIWILLFRRINVLLKLDN